MVTTDKEKKNIMVGEVLSNKMDKTIVVRVERTFIHPRFEKVIKSSKKYKVHDADKLAQVGDTVEIFEGRPVSKTKYMYLHRIVRSLAGAWNKQR